jgi:hypothetical protein
MGNQMDEQGKIISREIDSFCRCLRHFLFWVILRHFLAEEEITHAWTYFLKLTHLKRLGFAYRFRLPSLFSAKEQTKT